MDMIEIVGLILLSVGSLCLIGAIFKVKWILKVVSSICVLLPFFAAYYIPVIDPLEDLKEKDDGRFYAKIFGSIILGLGLIIGTYSIYTRT